MVFQNNVLLGAGGSGTTTYTIDQSIRFNDDDSAYMYRTPSSASDRDKWTWSAWIKKGNSGQNGMLFFSTFRLKWRLFGYTIWVT